MVTAQLSPRQKTMRTPQSNNAKSHQNNNNNNNSKPSPAPTHPKKSGSATPKSGGPGTRKNGSPQSYKNTPSAQKGNGQWSKAQGGMMTTTPLKYSNGGHNGSSSAFVATPLLSSKKKSTNQMSSPVSMMNSTPRSHFKKSGSLSPTPRSVPSTPLTSRNASTPSPQCFAGSKCYAPPTPDALPKPPPSWTSSPANLNCLMSLVSTPMKSPKYSVPQADPSLASQHLKLLLKVQA
ncbi:proline-rich nuclear receptor coactivator 2-like [Tigriopus californicus]|nr:proline-rich nuclear receptor coactivator 2-like [Tigriopus californicus]